MLGKCKKWLHYLRVWDEVNQLCFISDIYDGGDKAVAAVNIPVLYPCGGLASVELHINQDGRYFASDGGLGFKCAAKNGVEEHYLGVAVRIASSFGSLDVPDCRIKSGFVDAGELGTVIRNVANASTQSVRAAIDRDNCVYGVDSDVRD